MTESLLSVRGEAQRTVPPDWVRLPGHLSVTRASKAEALRDTSSALTALTTDLAALGAVPLDAGTAGAALTWSAHGASSHPDVDHRTGRLDPAGRTTGTVSVELTVRDLERLDPVSDVLARHEALQLHGASWGVDADHPAWPEVRAEAIRAALQKARDYAAALGATLVRVEHVADAGLLSPAGPEGHRLGGFVAQSAMGGGDAPSLTPLPQLLVAAIDARVAVTAVRLDG